jgi:hypothetical protein
VLNATLHCSIKGNLPYSPTEAGVVFYLLDERLGRMKRKTPRRLRGVLGFSESQAYANASTISFSADQPPTLSAAALAMVIDAPTPKCPLGDGVAILAARAGSVPYRLADLLPDIERPGPETGELLGNVPLGSFGREQVWHVSRPGHPTPPEVVQSLAHLEDAEACAQRRRFRGRPRLLASA